jgi:hypothetical protein
MEFKKGRASPGYGDIIRSASFTENLLDRKTSGNRFKRHEG